MTNLNTKNQSKDKIVSTSGYSIGSFTCYNANNDDGANIQLTSLEEMWYGHEENIDHPEGSEYPVSINVRDFDSIIHATTSPGRDKQGNIINHGHENIIRNV